MFSGNMPDVKHSFIIKEKELTTEVAEVSRSLQIYCLGQYTFQVSTNL